MLYKIVKKILSFFHFLNKEDYLKNVVEKDILKMEDLITFFKSEDIMENLKSDANILAVSIISKDRDYYKIICTLYNNEKKEVLIDDNLSVMFKSKDIDDDLKKAFSDKDMIVFK